MVGSDLSDHGPAPWVKKNASRHRTDILTGQGRLREPRKGARAPAIFAGCTPIHLAIGKKAFAGVPQVPRKTFWRLRESRKSHEKLFGVCGSPASLSKNFLVFAGAPQVSRKNFWCLREFRKSLEKIFGVCGSSASLSKNFLAFAGIPQVSRKTFWCLRESRKRLGKCREPRAACANVGSLGGVCCCTPTA